MVGVQRAVGSCVDGTRDHLRAGAIASLMPQPLARWHTYTTVLPGCARSAAQGCVQASSPGTAAHPVRPNVASTSAAPGEGRTGLPQVPRPGTGRTGAVNSGKRKRPDAAGAAGGSTTVQYATYKEYYEK